MISSFQRFPVNRILRRINLVSSHTHIFSSAAMPSKKLLTLFGATGNQGGSVIDTYFALPDLQEKYSLRGITRDPSSAKSKALAEKGVEMVQAELDDVESLKKAIKGSYGVFGITDFWSLMDKQKEINQGKNIFEACKAEGVKHFVFSSLPYADKITNGVLKNVDHFDSKAMVAEFVEENKGDMIASYVMPGESPLSHLALRQVLMFGIAMFIEALARGVKVIDGQASLNYPFPSVDMPWALLAPRRDLGKYVMGVFEGGSSANGVKVHAVSCWTTPKEVAASLSENSNQKDIKFNLVSAEMFHGFLKPNMGEVVATELVETMRFAGDYSYYGKGEEKNQAEHDKWIVKGAGKNISYPQWAQEHGPFTY